MAYSNTLNTYLETEVLSADPVKLVSLLYRGALEAVGAARRHLEDGDIPARSAQIMKAWDILAELLTSLEAPIPEAEAGKPDSQVPEQAQELVAQLHDLYGYMQQRLLDANAQQSDEPLAEVASLLTTLAEAWSGLAADPQIAAELKTARESEARRIAERRAPETRSGSHGGTPAGGSRHDGEASGYEALRYHPLRAAL